MSDRVKGLTVILTRDLREDDVQLLVDAISMLRGVKKVTTVIAEHLDYIIRERTITEMEIAIAAAVQEARNKK